MTVLWLVLLGGLLTFFLGVFVWVFIQNLLTIKIPPTLKHPVKLRILHSIFEYLITLGTILEKLRICSMPAVIQFVQDLRILKKDPNVLVTDTHFGTVPVRLFKPKEVSSKLRRGIIFYHGGGAVCGSLNIYHGLGNVLACETDSVVLLVGYRKLPDYHHPIVHLDCLNASIHFLKNLQTYGVDPSRVVISGESIGSWAVATVTQALVSQPMLPKIRAQVLITPGLQGINFQLPSQQQNQNVPLLSRDIMITFICRYLCIDLSWKNAILTGACVPLDTWKKYSKWVSSDNIPQRFKSKNFHLEFLGPFNETAYLETKHILDVNISPLLADDRIIAQLPEAFLVSCEYDAFRDDAFLYKKRLEDQGVPVSWYHAEDGFHGCICLFDKQPFSFPCSINALNAVINYIKGV
ncbi:arylacetamide deacetylase-like 4 [Arvicanthis niloticus]|uniref:arylacetamide deacetylase-like 4 n=1 Tax=Arvicanthis niloticus TaxID=61156 RepID=UPI0014870B09|nr:arylacetamide deacetylase-like 4 [Arvicanthis niloticus]